MNDGTKAIRISIILFPSGQKGDFLVAWLQDVGCCVGINLVAARVGKKMGVFVCLRMHVAGFGPVELFDSDR